MAAQPQPVAAREERLYRIGEVCRLTDTKAFVLRYWETEFPMLQPVKSPKGHRLYRQQDIETVLAIKRLLYQEGFTIAGARKHLAEGGTAAPVVGEAAGAAHLAAPASRRVLQTLREELREILTLLEPR
jgi:DNA-binding transcriptional MerR regulator